MAASSLSSDTSRGPHQFLESNVRSLMCFLLVDSLTERVVESGPTTVRNVIAWTPFGGTAFNVDIGNGYILRAYPAETRGLRSDSYTLR